MKKSLTYYLTLLVIKLKGIKKTFSTDPIDYQTLRKEDIHFPKSSFFKQNSHITTFQILRSTITEIPSNSTSKKLLLFVHGGAFVYGPVKHHWEAIKKINKNSDYTIWMCDYPKAPESTITEITKNIDAIYKMALQKVAHTDLVCIGDSVGATLLITLIQRLIKNNTYLPAQLFLISPVIDPSFENKEIDQINAKDPILSKKGVLSAKLMCAENQDLKDPRLSPIAGSFDKFPDTFLFIAEHDITYPDQKLFIKKMAESQVKIQVFLGEGMPHIWPLLPVMNEAKAALKTIISLLNKK